LISVRLRELAEETAEGERAEGGFRDFLRSDFWFQRWRIYELWIFVRVLRTLQRLGGKNTLLRIVNGVWNLKYGRDPDPVASCEIGGRRLDIYYQLYRTREGNSPSDDKTADMPDIAIFERAMGRAIDGDSAPELLGQAVAVIDPKHGLSYKRSKVDEVLMRYWRQFQPGLTAVINYYPMRSYPFNLSVLRDKRLVLASDVAPGSVSSRRLELSLEDTLLSRGLTSLEPAAKPLRITPERRRPDAGVLLYIASEIEVDEPEGPWILSERGGAVPVPGLRSLFGGVKEIDATHDGGACVLRTDNQWVWLVAKHDPRSFVKPADPVSVIGWNHAGTYYGIAAKNDLWVWKRDDGGLTAIPRPGAASQDSSRVIGWESTGEAVILEAREHPTSPLGLLRLDLTGRQTFLSQMEIALFRAYLRNGEVPATGEGAQVSSKTEAPLSVSPGGQYRVFKGPVSKRAKRGVKLLQVERTNDPGTNLPLIRFQGRAAYPIKWSLDQSRFAFLVERENEGGWPRSVNTLLYARPGDRYAEAVSLPGQDPDHFAWLGGALMESLQH
jgi:hypothetical protein